MATICLYQDTRHEQPLLWIRKTLGIGYLSRRNDCISELRINGFKQVKAILLKLQPFIRFKKKQTKVLIRACEMLERASLRTLTEKQLQTLIDLAFAIKKQNYVSRSSHTKESVYARLGLTP